MLPVAVTRSSYDDSEIYFRFCARRHHVFTQWPGTRNVSIGTVRKMTHTDFAYGVTLEAKSDLYDCLVVAAWYCC